MGELEPWIDENFVRSVWFNMGEQVNVKMIRDKFSGYATLRLLECFSPRRMLILVVMLAIASSILRVQLQRPKRSLTTVL